MCYKTFIIDSYKQYIDAHKIIYITYKKLILESFNTHSNRDGECKNNNYRRVSRVLIKRGDIFYADLRPVIGSEQGGIRPVLIVQNDIGNRYSPTVICAAITSQINKAKLPTHVEIEAKRYDLVKDSVVLLEQVRTIDKKRLKEKVCHLENDLMEKVNKGLNVSFGVDT